MGSKISDCFSQFSQKTAGNRRSGSVTLGQSPLARPDTISEKRSGQTVGVMLKRSYNNIRDSTSEDGQQTRVYPYPLGAGSARPNPKMGAPDTENPLFLGFSVLRGRWRPWSETMVSEGARPWGRGRCGDCEKGSEKGSGKGSGERFFSVERVLRRASSKGFSRRCLERPLGECDPLGVRPRDSRGQTLPQRTPTY